MSEPKRIQRKRTKGWRMPENTVYVGRPGPFGNPWKWQSAIDAGFAETEAEARAVSVKMLRLEGPPPEGIERLRGKDLACWCPLGQPCHADVLLEWANS